MGAVEYSRRRGTLLQSAAWHAWAHRRGYNVDARDHRKANQRELVSLRMARRVGE